MISFGWQLIGSHTQNTLLSSAVSVSVPTGATAVILTARTQAICFTLDGTTPTASKGNLLEADKGSILVPTQAGQTLKFIEAAASAKLDYQFVSM